jgi:hypothetical protein
MINILITIIFLLSSFVTAKEKTFFQTWHQPEYQEWAEAIDNGYLLYIIFIRENSYITTKASLLMENENLPSFKVIEQKSYTTMQDALIQIDLWKSV